MIEKILTEICRLKKDLEGYSAVEALDYIESYINILQREQPEVELTDEVKRYYSENFSYINSDQPTLSILTKLAKRLLDEAIDKVRKEYDRLVAEGKLPEGQFDTFYAGYGLALLEQKT